MVARPGAGRHVSSAWDATGTARGMPPAAPAVAGSLWSPVTASRHARAPEAASVRSGPEPLRRPRSAGRAGDLAGADLLVQGEDGVQQRLGRRRAAGGVDVDRDDLVHALDDGVVVEHPAGRGAHAHGDDPLGLHHLVVDLAEHRGHLLGDPAGHDHEVGLAGRGPEDLHAEAADVEVGRARPTSSRWRSRPGRRWPARRCCGAPT